MIEAKSVERVKRTRRVPTVCWHCTVLTCCRGDNDEAEQRESRPIVALFGGEVGRDEIVRNPQARL